MKLKYLIVLIIIASFSSIIYGFSIKNKAMALSHKYIGFGTVGIFLVAMPLFIFKESKGKKMKDYMLTEDNIKRMRKKEKEKFKS